MRQVPTFGVTLFHRVWNKIPYGYWGYRLENKISEFLHKNCPVKINHLDDKFYAHYLPCGKNERWWEVRVDNKDSIITLKEVMSRKWMKEWQ